MYKNRIESITIIWCYHEDIVITVQASFIDSESKLTYEVHVIFIFKVGNIL